MVKMRDCFDQIQSIDFRMSNSQIIVLKKGLNSLSVSCDTNDPSYEESWFNENPRNGLTAKT